MATHAHLKKNRIGIILKLSLILCNLLSLLKVSGQETMNKSKVDRDELGQDVPKRKLFSLYAVAGFSQRAKLERESGDYVVTSTPQPAGELGVNLQCDLNDNFLFITGLAGTITGRNAVFSNPPIHQINPIYPDPFPLMTISDADFCASIPLWIEREWRPVQAQIIFARAGLNFKYSFGYDEDVSESWVYDTSNQRINVFSLELNSNNHNKPWFTYMVGGGYGWTLKNHDLIKLGLVANISFTKFVSGTYEVNIPGHPLTQGSYKVTGTYVALSFSYTFVRFQKL